MCRGSVLRPLVIQNFEMQRKDILLVLKLAIEVII